MTVLDRKCTALASVESFDENQQMMVLNSSPVGPHHRAWECQALLSPLQRLFLIPRTAWVLNAQITCILCISHFQIYILKVILALFPVLTA